MPVHTVCTLDIIHTHPCVYDHAHTRAQVHLLQMDSSDVMFVCSHTHLKNSISCRQGINIPPPVLSSIRYKALTIDCLSFQSAISGLVQREICLLKMFEAINYGFCNYLLMKLIKGFLSLNLTFESHTSKVVVMKGQLLSVFSWLFLGIVKESAPCSVPFQFRD